MNELQIFQNEEFGEIRTVKNKLLAENFAEEAEGKEA